MNSVKDSSINDKNFGTTFIFGLGMRGKIVLFLITALVCMLAPLTTHFSKVNAVNGFTIHNVNTGLNYTTIQSAIDAIQTVAGNTLRVGVGTYNETLTVSKGVSVIGDNPSTTTINGVATLSSSQAKIVNFTLNGGVEVGYFGSNCTVACNTIFGSYAIGGVRVAAPYCTISNNIIINTDSSGVGVLAGEERLAGVDNGIVEHNEIRGFSGFSICIVYCNGWRISGNDIDNNRNGINLDHCLNCTITENSIHNDWVYDPPALYLQESSYNIIYHNNFFDNPMPIDYVGKQARILSDGLHTYSNYWDNGKEGNYWDDYNGTDRSDGIGDTPYVIGAGNQDNFPLMQMYLIPEFPSFMILSLFMIATLLVVMFCKRKKEGS